MAYSCEYISISSIQVEGDKTEDFLPKISIRIQSNNTWIYTTVVSSSYDEEEDTTLIEVRSLSLEDPCDQVEVSLVDPRALPEHEHNSYSAGGPNVVGWPPDHEWDGESIRFRKPDGAWGTWVNLKGPHMNPSSAWNSDRDFEFLDVVTHNGSSYLCGEGHTSTTANEPGIGYEFEQYWALLAEKGDTGETGDPGNRGITEVVFKRVAVGSLGDYAYRLVGIPGTTKTININDKIITINDVLVYPKVSPDLLRMVKEDADLADLMGEGDNWDIYDPDEEDLENYNKTVYVYLTNDDSMWFPETWDMREEVIVSYLSPNINGYLGSTGTGANAKIVGAFCNENVIYGSYTIWDWDTNANYFRIKSLYNDSIKSYPFYVTPNISFNSYYESIALKSTKLLSGIGDIYNFQGSLTLHNISDTYSSTINMAIIINEEYILKEIYENIGPNEIKTISINANRYCGEIDSFTMTWQLMILDGEIIAVNNTTERGDRLEVTRFPASYPLFMS